MQVCGFMHITPSRTFNIRDPYTLQHSISLLILEGQPAKASKSKTLGLHIPLRQAENEKNTINKYTTAIYSKIET